MNAHFLVDFAQSRTLHICNSNYIMPTFSVLLCNKNIFIVLNLSCFIDDLKRQASIEKSVTFHF
jgi:hypothetical protein